MAVTVEEIDRINYLAEKEPALSTEHNIEEHIAFGGDDQWFYNRTTKRFDLSRGSTRKLTLDADDGIRNHRGVMIDPAKTILVPVDMQNFFLHPAFADHSEGLKTVEPLIKVIRKCRKEGIQVCWLNWGIDEGDLKVMPAAVMRAFNHALVKEGGHGWYVNLGAQLPPEKGGSRCLFKGTWSAQIYDPLKDLVEPDDMHFDKARMSGLWSPELPMHKWLRESGKKTLLFCGLNTDQCLLGTLTDAYSWGWDCILIGDCASTMSPHGAQQVCDYNIATNMGFVTDAKTFCEAECEESGADGRPVG